MMNGSIGGFVLEEEEIGEGGRKRIRTKPGLRTNCNKSATQINKNLKINLGFP